MDSPSNFAVESKNLSNDEVPASTRAGSVRLVGLLGEGGMSQVYLAHHEGLGRAVAVKRLRRHLADVEEARERLRNEAELARHFHHENIVSVLDLVTEAPGETYLVMEHVSGEPLSARLARSGALPLSEVLTVGLQVSAALDAVHRRGIVHRDLKTENVLVGLRPDGTLLAKLIDFGLAEILGNPDATTECRKVVGTPESMAPEQATGGTVDRRSDIYSFGVLLYEMATGVPPFQGHDLSSLLQRVVCEPPIPPGQHPGAQKQLIPAALDELILDCLAKSPDRRPQDMGEVRGRLAAIAAEYRSLTNAVELALERTMSGPETEPEGFAKEALVVVEETMDRPMAVRSPVRAVGTSENPQIAAGSVAPFAQPRRMAPPAVVPLACPADQRDREGEGHEDEADEEAAVGSGVRPRVVRIVRMGLFVAMLAAGGVSLASTLSPSPRPSDEMDSPWPYLHRSLGR